MKRNSIKKITAILVAAAMMSAGTYMAFAAEEIDLQTEDVAAVAEVQEEEPVVEVAEAEVVETPVVEDSVEIESEVAEEVEAAEETEVAAEEEITLDEDIEEIEAAQIKTDFAFENDEVVITAKVSEEAALPETAEMKVVKLEAGSEKFEEAKQASIKDLGGSEDDEYVFYDVTFTVDGAEVDLEDGVAVINMQFKSADTTAEADTQCIHINETEAGAVAEDVTASTEDGTVKSVDFAM